MHRKIRFKFNERVNGLTFKNELILGEYRGVRNSFGALIFGIKVGSFDPPTLWTCSTFTLTRPLKPKPLTAKNLKLKAGDACTGLTKSQKLVSGFYMNSEGKHAWIRGWDEDTSKFLPKQAYKVLAETLKKI